MQAHEQVASVQVEGCAALTNPRVGTDAAALACKQRAVGADGRGAATSAPQAHRVSRGAATWAESGCSTLFANWSAVCMRGRC